MNCIIQTVGMTAISCFCISIRKKTSQTWGFPRTLASQVQLLYISNRVKHSKQLMEKNALSFHEDQFCSHYIFDCKGTYEESLSQQFNRFHFAGPLWIIADQAIIYLVNVGAAGKRTLQKGTIAFTETTEMRRNQDSC